MFANGQHIYLEDTYENTIHDLNMGSYSFSQTIGKDIADRFVLRFTNDALAIDGNPLANLVIYPNPSAGIFNISYEGNGTLEIEVFDLNGKQIIKSNRNSIDLSRYPSGIYIAKIQIDGQQVVKKLVLR